MVRKPYDDPAMWGSQYVEFSGGSIGTGIAVGDLDGDGLPDIYVVNKTKPNQLFKNLGGMKFKDVSAEANAPGGPTWKTGATLCDVDSDGDLDLYVCQFNGPNLLYLNDGKGHFTEGARRAGVDLISGSVVGAFCDYDRDGHPSALYLGDAKGKFTRSAQPQPWDKLAETEAMSAAFLEVNGDGAADLFVASGSVESDKGSENYRSHLHLNNGKGSFTEAPADKLVMPLTSAGAVAVADFNRDENLDVFVGGRVVPGEYPTVPVSALLQNQNGALVDGAEKLAPGLAKIGMVSAAVWTDVDEDGWLDLVVTGEWMTLRVFHNNQGTGFTETTEACGFKGISGWWNSLLVTDVNNDGHLDFVVGNIGLNTKYKADKKHPTAVNYLDFEGTGKCQVVESKYEGDRLIPVRGRSCSSQAMPSLREKFPTYHDFGFAVLPEIYGADKLKDSLHVEATELASGVFLNDGKGQFTFTALPRQGQIAPLYGIAAADFNGDGAIDLFLGENFRGPQVETGRYDGGISRLLLGDGKGGFRALTADESGILIPGEVRGVNVLDLNADGWPDLVVTQVNERVLSLQTTPAKGIRSTAIKLSAKGGNPDAIGARVTVRFADGSVRVSEIAAGSGYLCQSAPVAWVTYAEGKAPTAIEVIWPDGSKSSQPFKAGKAAQLVIKKP